MAAGCALAIDIGGTATKVGIVTPDGIVKSVDSIPTASDPSSFFERVFYTAERLCTTVNVETVGVGVAVAGFLDDSRSTMTFNPNIPWLEGIPLKQALLERFHFAWCSSSRFQRRCACRVPLRRRAGRAPNVVPVCGNRTGRRHGG